VAGFLGSRRGSIVADCMDDFSFHLEARRDRGEMDMIRSLSRGLRKSRLGDYVIVPWDERVCHLIHVVVMRCEADLCGGVGNFLFNSPMELRIRMRSFDNLIKKSHNIINTLRFRNPMLLIIITLPLNIHPKPFQSIR
jgi:hypothetical protein